ncbi:PR-1-like protein [Rhizoclosmatium globosum]|uniref:PR-1-like protein n=1 Tax=Rhizoclosmatium globosum TaxID=329046 RepID=A0A1Y2BC75_9FUNG|nr:PR-1-like protein [Rhizoclosmatium globosum]|eukprot:ORY32429.1 PR-1-like protein [Rhizoclosmatium globosum]
MPNALTSADITTIVDLHNAYRASNGIAPLQWASNIADYAVSWATASATYPQCINTTYPHGEFGPNGEYGQNIASSWGDSPSYPVDQLTSVTGLIKGWSGEAIPQSPGSYNQATQMLWGATTSIGCAKVNGQGCNVLVCDYFPRGQQWNTVGGKLGSMGSMITGIGTDTRLYSKNALDGQWTKDKSSAGLIDLIKVPTGFVGVAPDHTLWSATSLTGAWSLGLNGGWNHVPNSGAVFDISALSDGRILGVGLDYQLYVKPDLYANWQYIPNSGSVTRAKQQPDGSILGVGMDKTLWKMQTLGSGLTYVPNSCCVLSIVSYSL